MAIVKLQGTEEKRRNVSYQFDTNDKPIGEGGMGRVFKGICIDETTGASRPIAIKFMYDGLPDSAYERARREAEIQLRNDNLVEMLGFIETREKVNGEIKTHSHVISELLTGVSLSDVLEGKTKDRDGDDVAFAVKMLQQYKNDPERFATIIVTNVLSGLMALHDAGYIHRDIDPSNIMLTTDGHIKLIDFGIAKQMNALTTGDKALTVAGKFMGKPEYAAPELALGDIVHQNQTTDIYAVGILLYQCILGHTPFEGPRHEILEMQIKAKMPLEKIKNKGLRTIIATACQKKQELRYQTSAQMRVALETGGKSFGLTKKTKMAIIAAAVVLVVAFSMVTIIVKQKQQAAKAQAEQARMEQLITEQTANITAKISEGDTAYKQGLDQENDNYEQSLMHAYRAFAAAEKLAADSPEANYNISDITKKKNETMAALDAAVEQMNSQADQLDALDMADIAQKYRDRAASITDFKAKNK